MAEAPTVVGASAPQLDRLWVVRVTSYQRATDMILPETQTDANTPPRAGSWAPPAAAPPSAAMWTTRAAWLDQVTHHLTTPTGRALCRTHDVGPDTALAVAQADATAADGATGRGVTTANTTTATRVGCSVRAVQRAHRVMEALHLIRVLMVGRHLTTTERHTAREHHGRRQTRCGSVRACTTTRTPEMRPTVTPPTTGGSACQVGLGRHHQARDDAREAPTRRTRPTPNRPRPDLPTQRLAARLDQRMPWLTRTTHIGHLCHALQALGISDETHTTHQIIDAITRTNRAKGWTQPDANDQHDPIRLLTHQIRTSDLRDQPTTTQRAAAAQARLRTQTAARAAWTQDAPRAARTATRGAAAVRAALHATRAAQQPPTALTRVNTVCSAPSHRT
jgi:hypothetical protein